MAWLLDIVRSKGCHSRPRAMSLASLCDSLARRYSRTARVFHECSVLKEKNTVIPTLEMGQILCSMGQLTRSWTTCGKQQRRSSPLWPGSGHCRSTDATHVTSRAMSLASLSGSLARRYSRTARVFPECSVLKKRILSYQLERSIASQPFSPRCKRDAAQFHARLPPEQDRFGTPKACRAADPCESTASLPPRLSPLQVW